MKLVNPLKLLTWKSLFRQSGRRLRRARSAFTPVGSIAAEILEERALLSNSNVALAVSSGAITLTTTDNSGNSAGVAVHRVDSTNVEFDLLNGATQITYLSVVHTSSFTVAIPTVASITVNTGAGSNDFFDIYDVNTTGNITVNGKSTGITAATYADVHIHSETATMTVGGSITANLGSQKTEFEVYSDGPAMNVTGSIQVTEGGAGTHVNDFYGVNNSALGGALTVGGKVVVTASGTGHKTTDFYVDFDLGGSVLVNGNATVSDTGTGAETFKFEGGASVNGNLSFSHAVATGATDDVQIGLHVGDVFSGAGAVVVKGILTINLCSTSNGSGNHVMLGGDGDGSVEGSTTELTVNSTAILNGGTGADLITIDNVIFRNTVTVDTKTNPAAGAHDTIHINGSEFDLPVTLTMSGRNAEIDISDSSGYGQTKFKNSIKATMPGPGDTINLNSAGTGIAFGSQITITGNLKLFPTRSGTLHVFNSGSISYSSLPVLINWAHV